MKQKIKTILLIGVIVIMGLSVLGGCGNSGISFTIIHNERGSFGFNELIDRPTIGLLVLVTSYQELRDLCEEWDNPAFDEEHNQFNSTMSVRIRNFDEQFFSEKMLVIYTFERGHARETRINYLIVEGTELIIYARFHNVRGTFTDEAFPWTMLIVIPLQYVENVTTVSVNHK